MAPSRRDHEAERRIKETEARAIGQRLRKQRLTAGLTREQLAQSCSIPLSSYLAYELGSQVARPWRLRDLALGIGCPVAALFTDDVVLAELRVSESTLERVRAGGMAAAEAAIGAMAPGLAALLLAEATRPPVFTGHGARPRKRRTRKLPPNTAQAALKARKAREARDQEIS